MSVGTKKNPSETPTQKNPDHADLQKEGPTPQRALIGTHDYFSHIQSLMGQNCKDLSIPQSIIDPSNKDAFPCHK